MQLIKADSMCLANNSKKVPRRAHSLKEMQVFSLKKANI